MSQPGVGLKTPRGWNFDEAYLAKHGQGFPDDEYGLPPARALLTNFELDLTLMAYEDTHYLWWYISGCVARIEAPKALSEILLALDN
ncbi:MAG: hypothetical protein MMC33_008921 [Icmadophila ericetorum]|nr:hypothetical protein [Icmadophila ericetorum]